VAAVGKKDRTIVRQALSGAAAKAKVEMRSPVSRLPEAVRARLLGSEEGGRRAGLLSLLSAGPSWTRFASWSECGACRGSRLAPFPSAVRVEGETLPALLAMPAAALRARLAALALPGAEGALARPARDDALARLAFLEEVGLGYLAPARGGPTLSGGELRRAQLAAACAARMSGLLYLLDEPTAGLHPADRGPLRARLRALVREGNTVVCVEHDPAVLDDADHVVELGPGAGAEGGRILAEGPAAAVLEANASPIARARRRTPPAPRAESRARGDGAVRVVGARHRNLRGIDASFPVGALTCVTGVSGAGKSTLVLDVLAPAARAALGEVPFPTGRLDAVEGMEGFDRVSVSDGAPSRHPRATPGSVLGALDPVRALFAATVEARARGWGPSRFSTNVAGGRCEACRGTGLRSVRLRHLPDLEAPCDVCEGRRFRRETLEVRVKGLSIADVLDLPLSRAAEVFRDLRGADALRAAVDVGLGYVPLGEPTHRLSGGEALRLRLAAALGRRGRSRALYLLDEPCAGLHPDDVEHLARLLVRLASEGNAVVAVEHHPDLVRQADHVVDLGPGPGEAGGRVLVEGPPALVARSNVSPTGRVLG
jgi:excinuclease ABC subunit A